MDIHLSAACADEVWNAVHSLCYAEEVKLVQMRGGTHISIYYAACVDEIGHVQKRLDLCRRGPRVEHSNISFFTSNSHASAAALDYVCVWESNAGQLPVWKSHAWHSSMCTQQK